MNVVLLCLHLHLVLHLIRLFLHLSDLHLVWSLQIALSAVLAAPLLVDRPLDDRIIRQHSALSPKRSRRHH